MKIHKMCLYINYNLLQLDLFFVYLTLFSIFYIYIMSNRLII